MIKTNPFVCTRRSSYDFHKAERHLNRKVISHSTSGQHMAAFGRFLFGLEERKSKTETMMLIQPILDCETKFYSHEGIRVPGRSNGHVHCLRLMFILVGVSREELLHRYVLKFALCDASDVETTYDGKFHVLNVAIGAHGEAFVEFRVDGMGKTYSLRFGVQLVEMASGKVVASMLSRRFQQLTKRKSSLFSRKSQAFIEEGNQRTLAVEAGKKRMAKYAQLFATCSDPQSVVEQLEKENRLENLYPVLQGNNNLERKRKLDLASYEPCVKKQMKEEVICPVSPQDCDNFKGLRETIGKQVLSADLKAQRESPSSVKAFEERQAVEFLSKGDMDSYCSKMKCKRNYFESLAQGQGDDGHSHDVIDLTHEVIDLCGPENEAFGNHEMIDMMSAVPMFEEGEI